MTKIGYQAFCEALSLKNVEIPAGVNYIGAFAFENTAIEKVTIPAGVTDILNATFSGCASLADVTFISEAPPTVDKSAFEGIAQPCTGHCPEDTEELYQSTPGLEGITFKKASGISTPEIDANESVMLYDMSGRRVAPASYYGPAISIRTKDGHRICRKVMR